MKFILLVCDGMSDVRGKNAKTPLEFADTPNFDSIASLGMNGIMDVVGKGIVPNSDTGHLSLLGYDLKKHYPGRGPLEALGAEMKLKEGDIAFRANIATVESDLTVINRRAGRIKGDLSELEEAVNSIDIGMDFEFKHTVDHRGAFVLRGTGKIVSDTDPHKENKKILKSKGEKKAADAINLFSKKCYEVLNKLPMNKERDLPANMILLRGAGLYKEVPSFFEMHKLQGAVIATVALVRGVAHFTGMDILEVEGASGTEDTNIHGKFKTAVDALENYDFVIVNVKATDNFGHDGNFEGKVRMIQKIDEQLPVLRDALEDCILVITADHSTPVSNDGHSADPVPICISGNGIKSDNVTKFSEYGCAKGSLKRMKGIDLMKILKKYR